MSVRSLELREEAGRLVNEARGILEAAEARMGEERGMTKDETERFDKLHDEADRKIGQADRMERQESAEVTEPDGEGRAKESKEVDERGTSEGEKRSRFDTDEYREAFTRYLQSGQDGLGPELRATLQMDNDIGGGYLVASEQFVNRLIQAVDDMTVVRSRATRFTTRAHTLGCPSLDTDPNDFDWTAELTAVTEDTAMAFGKRQLTPHPLSKLIKVSRELLRSAIQNPETIVRDRLAYKFASTQETAFMTGSGSNQPLGLFTASNEGISTSRDVSTDMNTTEITADGLINCLYTLKAQYQMRSEWMFHRDAIKQIRKLKDGNGQYLWQPGLAGGQPGTILDRPFVMSEFVPNTFTTGLYVGMIGDFSNYWIADSLDLSVQRLVELYAATNQIGLIARGKTDAMPVLEEAFVRVKLA